MRIPNLILIILGKRPYEKTKGEITDDGEADRHSRQLEIAELAGEDLGGGVEPVEANGGDSDRQGDRPQPLRLLREGFPGVAGRAHRRRVGRLRQAAGAIRFRRGPVASVFDGDEWLLHGCSARRRFSRLRRRFKWRRAEARVQAGRARGGASFRIGGLLL